MEPETVLTDEQWSMIADLFPRELRTRVGGRAKVRTTLVSLRVDQLHRPCQIVDNRQDGDQRQIRNKQPQRW